ncbi:glycoside hydrolase family 3 N-terminal domain-containing protein [Psychrilyobacter atlanticus]|uniref:glycoside hydrolase family 3 N-terminal domain-containing protein n=1 Tax=Psychrilyobacter atlanticus TaxID=271091 RepID=UPI0004254217|nr:glycoside hydrolase family 3 N-terminal domain-containing protein [Psychrilyobacter atlanticus]
MKKYFKISEKENIKIINIIKSMSIEDKIGQLLFLKQEGEENFSFTPGGVMFRPLSEGDLGKLIRKNNSRFKIQSFISANLESGPKGMILDGIDGVTPLQVVASDEVKSAYDLGKISGEFGKLAGANMTFSPIVDINMNMNNPMVNTRSFGDSVEKIIEYGEHEFNGFLDNDVIPVIKHFPGDGVSDTDQHLLTAVNDLDYEKWKSTYGKVYSKFIDLGAEVIMVGHISLPKYVSKFNEKESYHPASTSKYIIKKLLKEELGYDGLIMTDSTLMAGYTSYHSRKEAIIRSLNSGVDMILFSRDGNEDFEYIKEGYDEGKILLKEIDEKVKKILSLKIKYDILEGKIKENSISKELKEEGSEVFNNIIGNSITLLKDSQKLLPIKFTGKKILLIPITRTKNKKDIEVEYFIDLLKKENVDVSVKKYRGTGCNEMEDLKLSVKKFKEKYDLVIYLVNVKVLSNRTSIKMEYNAFNGVDAPWFINEVNTMLISLSNPFHDYDAPMIKTVINGYNDTKGTIDCIMKKIKGEDTFRGVDPFGLRRGYE